MLDFRTLANENIRENIPIRIKIHNDELHIMVSDDQEIYAKLIPEARKVGEWWIAPMDATILAQIKLLFPTHFEIESPELGLWYLNERRHHRSFKRQYKVPDDLYPYQAVGSSFLINAGNAGLFDDLGLGKTLQAITAVQLTTPRGQTLVICPSILKTSWANEIEKWTGADTAIVQGSKRDRVQTIQSYQSGYLIIGIELVRLHPELRNIEWDWTIVDEAHRIMNHESKQTRAVKLLTSARRVALTGTPLLNRPDELWSILNYIEPQRFKDRKHFVDYYDTPVKLERQLGALLKPFVLRRTKDQCLPDLPPKIYQNIKLELTGDQEHLYDSMKAQMRTSWQSKTVTALNVLTQVTRLRQLVCSPMVLGFSEPGIKFEAIKEILEDNPHTRFIVFSKFATAVDALGAFLSDSRVLTLTGKTPQTKRNLVLAQFKKQEDAVLILTIQIGGVGLTLTEASNMIFLDKPWSPATLNQAEDRLHRISQVNPVNIMSLHIADTVDQRHEEILTRKDEQFISPAMAAIRIALEEELLQEAQVKLEESEMLPEVIKEFEEELV